MVLMGLAVASTGKGVDAVESISNCSGDGD